ncbi:MAG: ATP-binding protein [Bacteroidota bacterium]
MADPILKYQKGLPAPSRRRFILERIFFLVGSAGLVADGIVAGAFAPGAPEMVVFRLICIAICAALFVLSYFQVQVIQYMYSLTRVVLYLFIALVIYLNYIYGFGFEYVLMLHVGVVISSIYFRQTNGLMAYLIITYLLVVYAAFTAESHFIPMRILLIRLVLTMACGYGLNMLNRDIVQRLQYSDQRFRLLAENGTDLIALHDATGRIQYVNLAAERMLGYAREEVLEMNAFSLIHPCDQDEARRSYYQQVYKRGTSVQLEYRLICKDGSVMWVEVVGTPLGPESPPLRIITTSRDISERKRAEEETLQYQENLLQINNELDQFAYVVSHDLKAPLRGISNLTTFIEEDMAEVGELPGDVQQQLTLMRARVGQMEQLIEDVLAFSRAGRLPVESGEVDLQALLERVVNSIGLPEGFAVTLPDDLPSIYGARVHFEQIFTNLITNAWKHHHRDHGHIGIRYADTGNFHRIEVSDDGPGIAEQFHERIFEVFQQLSSKSDSQGSGIGLAIVRKIVRSQGGQISLRSTEGKGTTFRILWPKTPTPSTAN